jgi:RecB family endonuclease NucS
MEVVSPSVRVSKEGRHVEIDVLAYSNGDLNTAYIVEVKSHAREESIAQLKSILQRFRSFFPEHRDKRLYGILAAVDMSPELRQKTLQEGFYVARIHDEVFELDIPENFQPQSY